MTEEEVINNLMTLNQLERIKKCNYQDIDYKRVRKWIEKKVKITKKVKKSLGIPQNFSDII